MEPLEQWDPKQKHIKAAIAWLAKHNDANTEDLVDWDQQHGRRIFCWDATRGAAEFRLTQARRFINRLSYLIDKVRMHRFYSLADHEAREAGQKNKRKYVNVRVVVKNSEYRAEVIHMLTAKMATLARELAFFRLSPVEMKGVLDKIELALEGKLLDKVGA